MTVRRAVAEDLPRLEALYADARRFMAENGSPPRLPLPATAGVDYRLI